MKYLEDAALAALTALLSDCPIWSSSSASTDGTNSAAANSRTLHGRLEAYTTKRAGSDKKLAHDIYERYEAEQEAAVADDKLAALIRFQKDQLQHLTSSSVIKSRKRRSASTGEEPLELQKSPRPTLSPPIAHGRRGRANSLDIPRQSNTSTTTKTNAVATTKASTTNTTATTTGSTPPQPNFRALSLAPVSCALLTDLILTLNNSFPDYDFSTAATADFTVCTVQTAVTRINERLGEFSAATSTLNSSFLKTMNAGNGGSLYNDGSSFLSTLWKAVDNVICLSEVTEVYSYQPRGEVDDPHSFLQHSLVKGGWGDYDYDVVGSGPGLNVHRTNQYCGVVQTDDDVSEYDDGDDDLDHGYNKSRQAHGTAIHREVLWTFNYFFVNKAAKRILLFTCIETMTRLGYSMPPAIPSTFNQFARGMKTANFNAIPEHEAVHHQLHSNTMATPTSEVKRHRSRRRHKYLRQSSPSILPSDEDVSGNDDDDDKDDDDDDELDDEYDDDDSHTIASSSAVSVDFDLDPANAVSGGIPIGN